LLGTTSGNKRVSHTAIATAPSSARRWVACVVLLAGAFLPPADFFIVNVTLSLDPRDAARHARRSCNW
jgi:hypothetical protein